MAHKFTKDTIITTITNILILVISIGTSIIIARFLGPRGKGLYTLAFLFPTFLITFTNIGIGPATVYYIGKKKYSIQEIFGVNIIFSFLISLFSLILAFLILLFFSQQLFPNVPKNYLFFSIFSIPIQVLFTFIIEIFLGLQKIKKYNFIFLLQSFLFFIFIFCFLTLMHQGVKMTIFSTIFSYFLTLIFLIYQTKKEIGSPVFSFNKNIIKDFLQYGAKCYISNILGFLHYRVDQFMINFFLNPTAVGIYSIAVGISEKLWLIPQSAATVLFPRVSSEKDKKKLKEFTPIVCRNVFFITIFSCLILFLMGKWIILFLYSEKFLKSVSSFQFLLIGAVTFSASKILSSDIAGRGKPEINTYIGIFSVLLNIILNAIFIPKIGIVGAAWATAISYSFNFFSLLIIYAKISGNKIKDVVLIKKNDIEYYKKFISLVLSRVKIKKYGEKRIN
jgi:O-antigen/teichoic acid export membrane protein